MLENTIELSEYDLIKLKQLALSNYKQKSIMGMSSDAFWSKCVVEATKSILSNKGLILNIKYPEKGKKVDV